MAAIGRHSRFAMHRRDGLPEQHRKKFVACAEPAEATLVHEDDLVDEGKQIGAMVDDHDGRKKLPVRPDAFFALEDSERPTGANQMHFFLEADRSTGTQTP